MGFWDEVQNVASDIPGLGSLASGKTPFANLGDWWQTNGVGPYQAPGYQVDKGDFGPMTTDQGLKGRQGGLLDMLTAQANGSGPSIADLQLQQGTQRNLNNAVALQAANPSLSPALAATNVARNQADISQQAAGQSAITRLQEEMAARNALAGAVGEARSQDIAEQASNQRAREAYENLQGNLTLGQQGINAQGKNQQMNDVYGAIGGLIQGGANGVMGAIGLADGGIAPGPDTGQDSVLVPMRGGEVAVPPESTMYTGAMIDAKTRAAARNGLGSRLLDWLASSGQDDYFTPRPSPSDARAMRMLGPPRGGPSMIRTGLGAAPVMGRRAMDLLDAHQIGGIGNYGSSVNIGAGG